MVKKIYIVLGLVFCLAISSCSDVAVVNKLQNVNVTNVDEDGNTPVIIQDQTTEIVDLRLSELISNITIIKNTTLDDVFVNISSPIAPTIENLICFKENLSFYQSEILAVVALGGDEYQLRLQQPLDFAFTTDGGCSIREDNWAVDGSITTRVFSVSPFGLDPVTEWDITRVILACLGNGISGPDPDPDLSSFMVMDPLANGIVFRHKNGKTKNIFSARDNFHLATEAYDITLWPANRFGFYASTLRRTFNGADKNGVVIRLLATVPDDRFELIIQDDLTDMEECHAVIQGHVTTY